MSADGVPVAGAHVTVFEAAGRERVRRTRSDAAGEFWFRSGARALRVRAEHPRDGSVETGVLAATDTEPLVLVLVPPLAASGRVFDELGAPIADAEVRLESAGSGRSAMSAGSGDFSVSLAGPGPYRVTAWAKGFAARTLDVTLDRSGTLLDVTLLRARAVHGRVLDPAGKAVPDATLSVCAPPHEIRLSSAEDGSFVLGPSAIGCNVVASHASHSASEPVRVRNDGELVVRLGRGGSIEGIVTDDTGAGVERARLELRGFTPTKEEARLEGSFSAEHRPVGARFRLSSLAPGEYVLGVATSDDVAIPGSSVTVQVRAHAVTRGVHLITDLDTRSE